MARVAGTVLQIHRVLRPCRVWTPPLFLQHGDLGSTDSISQPMGTLQAQAQARLGSLQGGEDYAESYFPFDAPAPAGGDDSSSGETALCF